MPWRHRLAAALALVAVTAGVAAAAPAGPTTPATGAPPSTAASSTGPSSTVAATTTTGPKRGGRLVVAVGAESNGWLPATQNWGHDGEQVRWAVVESLTQFDSTGRVAGWLLTSVTANADATVWTLRLRSGIRFHNGENLDAAAVVENLDAVRRSPATAGALADLVGCTARGPLAVECRMRRPWVSFPAHLAGPLGAVVAPAQLRANDATRPIGTGPFRFASWAPNVRFTAVRNPAYWRAGLPLADEVEFRVVPDEAERLALLSTGRVHLATAGTPASARQYQAAARRGAITAHTASATVADYDLLNTAVAPFDNRDCRLAAAQALDLPRLVQSHAPGAATANGPFAAGTPGHLSDSGYPAHDLAAARASFARCRAASAANASFTMATTTSPGAAQTRDAKRDMLAQAGFRVRTVEIGQDGYVPAALVGSFQWQTWRMPALPDLDLLRPWWHSETALTAPRVALNAGRVQDRVVDAALDRIRTSADPAARTRAAQALSRRLGQQAYVVWNWTFRPVVGVCRRCTGFDDQRLPADADGRADRRPSSDGIVRDIARLAVP